MIVKFHARGAGRGSGPVDYLLGKNRDREGATLDRGDPSEIQALIDTSPYAKKYTSGVLSFEEPDLDRHTKDRIMSSFEQALLPGLDADQYSCLWVEHRDKGRLELNFVVPNVELLSGKRLQPYFDRADQPRINAWKTGINAVLNLHDPDDPKNKRELVTPRNLPASKQAAARSITDGLLSLANSGQVATRQDVVNTLQNAGFTVARQTKKSISIADPDGGRNIRLQGMIYEQDFRYGAGLRAEIEAAGARYRAESEKRVREAREVYHHGLEIKRAENRTRYKRPESQNERVGTQNMAVGGSERDHRVYGLSERPLVAGKDDQRELADDQRAKAHDSGAVRSWREDPTEPMRGAGEALRPDRRERTSLSGRLPDTEGVLNDRARNPIIERIRELTAAARRTAKSLCGGLQQLSDNVRNHLERERGTTPASEQLKRASQPLERVVQCETEMIPTRDRGMGFSR